MIRGAVLLTALCVAGCAGSTPPAEDAGSHAGLHLNACAALRSAGDVGTIFAAVERLNSLPPPVTPACFTASLPRPVDAVATMSLLSAQPAAGRESPRVFLLLPGLVVSVVPDGDGASLLEFAEWTSTTRTLKGELKFPLPPGGVPLDAPLTRVHSNLGVTTCGLCHRNETPHPTIDGGFVSDAFRPDPGTLVPISEVAAQHTACGEDAGPRCEVLHALFDFGPVRQGKFSDEVDLFVK
ncbi:MAG: hypothetical protein AB1938_13945 [Myxococcota bacterium]